MNLDESLSPLVAVNLMAINRKSFRRVAKAWKLCRPLLCCLRQSTGRKHSDEFGVFLAAGQLMLMPKQKYIHSVRSGLTIDYIDLIQAKLILAGKTLSRLAVNPFSGSITYEQGMDWSRSKRRPRVGRQVLDTKQRFNAGTGGLSGPRRCWPDSPEHRCRSFPPAQASRRSRNPHNNTR